MASKKRHHTGGVLGELPLGRALFLIGFSVFFFLLAGLLLLRVQSFQRSTTITIDPTRTVAPSRLVILGLKGLLFDEGITSKEITSTYQENSLVITIQAESAFSPETFKEKLLEFLPGTGYMFSPATQIAMGETETTSFLLQPVAQGSLSITVHLARTHVPVEEPVTSLPRARVAIVIDDLGIMIDPAEIIARLPIPVTLSIMPHQPASKETAEYAARMGKEILMHVPMEPLDFPDKDPGPGALFSNMTETEVFRILEDDLSTVPGAVGINNHMGSRLTADHLAMSHLMTWLSHSNLLFLDSRTSPDSAAYRKARLAGIKSSRRDVFLDNDDNPGYISNQIDELIRISLDKGEAVGIGHPRDKTLSVLANSLARFRAAGVEVVPFSEIAK